MPQDTELHKMAKDGDTETIKELLADGANVNALGAQGRTALQRALAGGFAECSAALIESGADATLVDSMKRTVLHCACLGPEAEAAMKCLEMLFEKQEEAMTGIINNTTKSGTTALHLVTEKGQLTMVKFLFERGADPELVDGDGKSSAAMAKALKLPKDTFAVAGAKKKKGLFGR